MDQIYECAEKFTHMYNCRYTFVISWKRKTKKIVLDFHKEDFRHMAGLHYIDDIEIEQSPQKIIQAILNGDVTDSVLQKSAKYKAASNSDCSVQERVEDLADLEGYLDKSDFIRIYKVQNFGSRINAEYFIESSSVAGRHNVYMFIRKRVESDNYLIVSFFRKKTPYSGDNLFWMLKVKEKDGIATELYRHPAYKD